jgi:hypothetical protein
VSRNTGDSVLIAVAAVITAVVTVHAITSLHMNITGDDFVLFLLVTTGALFIIKTILTLIWSAIRHMRRREP